MIKLKLNVKLRSIPAGKIIDVEVDSEGTPLDRFWARRLRDSVVDNCVEIVEITAEKTTKSKK